MVAVKESKKKKKTKLNLTMFDY